MRKILFLFFALLLPVLVYLFLKSFGKNEFEVPVLFADSVTAPVACNAYTYRSPYFIEDTILQKLDWGKNDSLTIVVFENLSRDNRHERNIQIDRILSQFKDEKFGLIRVFNTDSIQQSTQQGVKNIAVKEDEFNQLHTCIFLLSASHDAVIIDHHRCIRGQYTLSKREDADRMIMQEMNILFKRY